jgi:GNAT superfamily N-acetyltransferase
MSGFRIQAPASGDRRDWQRLYAGYAGYAEFYQTTLTNEMADRVWQWLLDPAHVIEGLLVRDSQAVLVGLLHVRACPHPLSGSVIGFVDDMYVAEHARGTGAASALIDALARLAEQRQWPRLRWVTQDHNAHARAVYDRITGGPSEFIMYNWSEPAANRPRSEHPVA